MAFFSKVFSGGQGGWTFSGCLNWCFRGQNSTEHQEIPGDNYDQKLVSSSPDEEISEYSITDHPKNKGKKAEENGTVHKAYDSSSDEDDVLRHYQESMQRTPSFRSDKSSHSQSAASVVSKQSRASKNPDAESIDGGQTMVVTAMVSSSADDGETFGIASVAEVETAMDQDAIQTAEADVVMASNREREEHNTSPEQRSIASSDQALSQYSASISLGDADREEELFDVSDLQDTEANLISKCGSLELSFSYTNSEERMSITVHQAREIPTKERGGASNCQVRLLLLPTKKLRHKTKVKPSETPDFQETFQFKVPLEDLNSMGVRFRIYGCERMRRERLIGEGVVGFASLNLDDTTTFWLTLEPRSNLSQGDANMDAVSLSRSDSASSTQSMQHGGMPELLVGLAYNGMTGRLSVEVIKGSNFRNMAMNRAPDTYAKLTLMSPNGEEITRCKTSLRRGQPNPLFKETFMLQVAQFQLPDVTLMVSVYNKRSMKRRDMIGWFSLGLNNSGEEELSHWNDMRESKGEQVCRWHVLLES